MHRQSCKRGRFLRTHTQGQREASSVTPTSHRGTVSVHHCRWVTAIVLYRGLVYNGRVHASAHVPTESPSPAGACFRSTGLIHVSTFRRLWPRLAGFRSVLTITAERGSTWQIQGFPRLKSNLFGFGQCSCIVFSPHLNVSLHYLVKCMLMQSTEWHQMLTKITSCIRTACACCCVVLNA